MKELFKYYLTELYNDVPPGVYEGLLSVFCLGAVVLFAINGFKKGWRYVSGLLLAEYITLLFCSMVLFRPVTEIAEYNFKPLWSYIAIHRGQVELIPENIMNVVAFVPLGLLAGMTFAKIKWWQVLLFGCGVSVLIESLQFLLKRGFSEFDDVLHNTLGCMIGYGIYSLVRMGCESFSKKFVAVL